MKHSRFMRSVWQAAVLAGLAAMPAWSTVLYSDGAINGILGASYINEGDEISDSFTISASSTLETVSDIGLWVDPADTPGTLNWIISTSYVNTVNGAGPLSDGGTIEGSGSGVSLSTSFLEYSADDNYAIFAASFSLGGLNLSPGTYYLTLEDAATVSGAPSGPPVLWDVTCGVPGCAPSTEYENGILGTSPNSFQIDGSVDGTAVPEPASLGFVIFGAALLVWLKRQSREKTLAASIWLTVTRSNSSPR